MTIQILTLFALAALTLFVCLMALAKWEKAEHLIAMSDKREEEWRGMYAELKTEKEYYQKEVHRLLDDVDRLRDDVSRVQIERNIYLECLIFGLNAKQAEVYACLVKDDPTGDRSLTAELAKTLEP